MQFMISKEKRKLNKSNYTEFYVKLCLQWKVDNSISVINSLI